MRNNWRLVLSRPRTNRASLWRDARSSRNGDGPGHLVVCDGVQDPSNLGSILRSAQAAGIRGLITTPNSVDPFHHRALRASMGAAFHLPILQDEPIAPLLATLKNLGWRTAALAANGETELQQLPSDVPYALLLGAEGSGLAPAVAAQCDLRVRIPMHGRIDSLGVAAAAAVVFFSLFLEHRRG